MARRMNNPLRMEYMHLLPWRRTGKENGDEEMGFDEDNLSESESHYHGVNPRGSVYSLNEGDLRLLGLLLENGGSNEETETTGVRFSGTTVNQRLMMAVEESDAGAVEFCLGNGADPNHQYTNNKITALHLAATVGSTEVTTLLVKNGANVQSADSRGVTPLHLAAGIGFLELVQQLIAAGADVNAQDNIRENGIGEETPLHRAASGGHLEIIRKLLLAGAKVDITEAKGRTPLHHAAHRGATGCIQALLDFKADPNALDKQGASALLLLGGGYMMKGHRRVSGYNESVEVLINGGAEVNVKDPNSGVTPLHQAVMLGRFEATKLLLINGAHLNSPDSEGGTAMHACALKGHASILKLLLAQPAAMESVNLADFKGRVPLHKAAYRGSVECIQLLLKAGADLGAKTKTGISATSLILQHPNGGKILGQRLDESISSNGIDPSEKACRVRFDYSILLTKHKTQQMGVVEDILEDRKERHTADLLQHPVIESFLFLKWRKIRFLFFSNVIFYLILVTGVTAYVLATVSNDSSPLPDNQNSTVATSDVRISRGFATEPATVLRLQLSLNVIILIIIFQEVVQFASLHDQYFYEAESWIKLGALVTSTIVIFSTPPWPTWVHHVSAVAVLLGWSEVTLLLGRLPTFGVYALMFFSVAQNLMKFIFVYFFFLAGFSFSFFLMFTNKHDAFNSPWTSMLRTFSMMLGDVSYDDYLTGDTYNLNGTAHVIYFTFLVLVSLILMNLLIGLAVNDIQGLQKEGRVKRLRKQAEFIVYLEDIASNRFLHWMICCGGIRQRLYNWVNLNPVYTFNPAARKKAKTRKVILPSSLIERTVTILQEGRAPAQSVTAADTYNLLNECMASIAELTLRMENLERGLTGSAPPGADSAETVAIGDDVTKSNDLVSTKNQLLDDTRSAVSDSEFSVHQDEDLGDSSEDVVDGNYRRKIPLSRRTTARTTGTRTTRTVKSGKSSIQSDLQDIKRMLVMLTSKSDAA